MNSTSLSIKQLVLAALFAALLVISGQITIPIGPVPITMQNFAVMLTGLLLGSRVGPSSVAVLFALAALGLPVLSGGSGGIAHLFGPTGGFLFSFILASFVIGWLAEKVSKRRELKLWHLITINLLGGVIIVYLIGVPWLLFITQMPLTMESITKVCLVFIPGDLAKAIVAALLAQALYKVDPSLSPAKRNVG